MNFKTPDLLDSHEDRIGDGRMRVVAPMFQRYGGRPSFSGQIVTLKIFEDNSLVREALAQEGKDKVLVVDGGGSMRCALVGDQLAILAHKSGWEGIVVYGCIRDSEDICHIYLVLRALKTQPMKLSLIHIEMCIRDSPFLGPDRRRQNRGGQATGVLPG